MVVQFGCFIDNRPNNQGEVQLRVSVVQDNQKDASTTNRFYVQHFSSIKLSTIRGNVIIPAKELLLQFSFDTPLDLYERVISVILHSELQEVQFDISKAKATCTLWFRCVKERPVAIMAMAELDGYFDPIPF